MTGFGTASRENDRYRVSVRVRSVNHRNLDVSIRLPEAYRASEPAIRSLATQRLARGRVELTIDIDPLLPPATRASLDRALVESVLGLAADLSGEPGGISALTAGDLLRTPGVLQLVQQPEDWLDGDAELLLAAVREAVDQVVAARRSEGKALARILSERLAELTEHVASMLAVREEVIAELQNNLRQKLDKLLQSPPFDEQRLAQEAAVLVERSDVTEELERLSAHLTHASEILQGPGPMGKRLDFLLQEIQRELNTLGAKSRDLRLSRRVLDGKVLCEQLREQVQNVE